MEHKDFLKDIDKRFEWRQVDGLTILFADSVCSTEEEKIAMIYRLPYYGTHFPEGVNKAYLLIKSDGQNAGIQPFHHIIQYAKKHNYFEKSVCYGQINPIWIASIKVVSRFLKHEVRLFKTEAEAIAFLKK